MCCRISFCPQKRDRVTHKSGGPRQREAARDLRQKGSRTPFPVPTIPPLTDMFLFCSLVLIVAQQGSITSREIEAQSVMAFAKVTERTWPSWDLNPGPVFRHTVQLPTPGPLHMLYCLSAKSSSSSHIRPLLASPLSFQKLSLLPDPSRPGWVRCPS